IACITTLLHCINARVTSLYCYHAYDVISAQMTFPYMGPIHNSNPDISERMIERVNTNITQLDHYLAVMFAAVECLSYVRSLIAATAEHKVYRTSRYSSIKHQLIELIRQR